MGCDIHMTVEERTPKGWVCIDTMNIHTKAYLKRDENPYSVPVAKTRNYQRFAALAGVRGTGPQPKGIPNDASETTRHLIECWGDDGHSHSWCSLNDACAIFVATEPQEVDPKSFKARFPGSHYFNVDGFEDKPDQYRLVFWFDN